MYIAAVVLAIVVALAFSAAGIPKILGAEQAKSTADHLRVPHTRYLVVGVLEALGAAGLLIGIAWGWLGVAAGAGLVALMVGAVITHARAGDSFKAMVPALAFGALAVASIVTRVLSL
ncbi:DoxX family protein [Nocardia sp. CA2R105]|uniref:DoxX family protein n=1 Tax=Nocardia coffeae TaxID=2873381 RepID=UPI001CA6BC18|nr:DoxX family protein [Nocardia coffeae]MBY8863411.1 DoxX family protein [Nocardia coffeae]